MKYIPEKVKEVVYEHIKMLESSLPEYNETEVEERFTCRFGINPEYRKVLDESGFKEVARDENGEWRVLDLLQNKFYLATLFQPQLSSLPTNPHKLILAYLTCVRKFNALK